MPAKGNAAHRGSIEPISPDVETGAYPAAKPSQGAISTYSTSNEKLFLNRLMIFHVCERFLPLPDLNLSTSYFANSSTGANFFSVMTLSAIEFKTLFSEQNATPIPEYFIIQISFSLSPIAIILAKGILYF